MPWKYMGRLQATAPARRDAAGFQYYYIILLDTILYYTIL